MIRCWHMYSRSRGAMCAMSKLVEDMDPAAGTERLGMCGR